MTTTLCQLNATIREADRLFARAANNAKVNGNNRGGQAYQNGLKSCDVARRRAETLLAPPFPGIAVDYPGLYPSFTVNGFSYHSTDTALSAAVGELLIDERQPAA